MAVDTFSKWNAAFSFKPEIGKRHSENRHLIMPYKSFQNYWFLRRSRLPTFQAHILLVSADLVQGHFRTVSPLTVQTGNAE